MSFKNILSIIISSIAVLAGYRKQIAELKKEGDQLRAEKTELAATLEKLNSDHWESNMNARELQATAEKAKAAAEAAELRASALEDQFVELDGAAEALAKEISQDPNGTPVVDGSFNVVKESGVLGSGTDNETPAGTSEGASPTEDAEPAQSTETPSEVNGQAQAEESNDTPEVPQP